MGITLSHIAPHFQHHWNLAMDTSFQAIPGEGSGGFGDFPPCAHINQSATTVYETLLWTLSCCQQAFIILDYPPVTAEVRYNLSCYEKENKLLSKMMFRIRKISHEFFHQWVEIKSFNVWTHLKRCWQVLWGVLCVSGLLEKHAVGL